VYRCGWTDSEKGSLAEAAALGGLFFPLVVAGGNYDRPVKSHVMKSRLISQDSEVGLSAL
jgi:hypothetical protein